MRRWCLICIDVWVTEQRCLVLDGQTLQNLEVLHNSRDHTIHGTLLELLDQCSTPFGKRLFKKWLCYPLLRVKDVEDRLTAVDDLMNCKDFIGTNIISNMSNILTYSRVRLEPMKAVLSKLPDIERMLSRIHAGSSKLSEFLLVLDSFEKFMVLITIIHRSISIQNDTYVISNRYIRK